MRKYLLPFLICVGLVSLPTLYGHTSEPPEVPKVEKQVVIRFSAEINDFPVRQLMNFMDLKRKHGTTDFIILISSPGVTVNAGLTVYNYLKGMPPSITITTHNFGIVDSIGVVMYCGGSKRLSVPQARFLIHGIKLTLSGPQELEEKSLEELLKRMKLDIENIAKVISANTNKNISEVEDAISERMTLSPDEAKKWGLVQEIKSQLYDESAPVYYIKPTPSR